MVDERAEQPAATARHPERVRPADLGIPLGTFAIVAAFAELLGADNLGIALGVGQVAFVAAVVFVILRRD